MRKVISLLFLVSLISACLVGCGVSEPIIEEPNKDIETPLETPTENPTEKPTENPIVSVTENGIGFDYFDTNLINYINNSEFKDMNYCVSPLSIKLALSLVAEGANGKSQEEVLRVLGVNSVEDLRNLSLKINSISNRILEDSEHKIETYKEFPYMYTGEPSMSVLKVNNSIWKNIEKPGKLLNSYKDIVKEYYNGVSEDLAAHLLVDNINNWVNENTNGLIPQVVDDSVSLSNIVLVNTLYMKSSWLNQFDEFNTKEQEFKTITGEVVLKDFMRDQNNYYYYEDKDTKLVILNTESNIYVAYVLGDNTNILEKIRDSSLEDTILELPKMEIESSFDSLLIDFMQYSGASAVFNPSQADFSNMIELENGENVYIGDIIHKTKLLTDETGIEGAAVTAVMLNCTGAYEEPREPKKFIADEPFSFYVFTDNSDSFDNIFSDIDLLFYGQYVE